jgi:Arc/MetJ family transcription regulator
MKSTIEIDSSLITNALQVTELTAQQEVIELALSLPIQMKNQQNLRALRGKLAWDGDLDRMRTDDDSDREQSFFEVAGIWEEKNITLDDIRKDAWGKDTFYVASQKNSITECFL